MADQVLYFDPTTHVYSWRDASAQPPRTSAFNGPGAGVQQRIDSPSILQRFQAMMDGLMEPQKGSVLSDLQQRMDTTKIPSLSPGQGAGPPQYLLNQATGEYYPNPNYQAPSSGDGPDLAKMGYNLQHNWSAKGQADFDAEVARRRVIQQQGSVAWEADLRARQAEQAARSTVPNAGGPPVKRDVGPRPDGYGLGAQRRAWQQESISANKDYEESFEAWSRTQQSKDTTSPRSYGPGYGPASLGYPATLEGMDAYIKKLQQTPTGSSGQSGVGGGGFTYPPMDISRPPASSGSQLNYNMGSGGAAGFSGGGGDYGGGGLSGMSGGGGGYSSGLTGQQRTGSYAMPTNNRLGGGIGQEWWLLGGAPNMPITNSPYSLSYGGTYLPQSNWTVDAYNQVALQQSQDRYSQIKALSQQMDQARQAGIQANKTRYDQILGYGDPTGLSGLMGVRGRAMGYIDQLGNTERSDINDQYNNAKTQYAQSLKSKGLSNTTIMPTAVAGIERQRSRALGDLNDRLLNQKSSTDSNLSNNIYSFMERRTDSYPSLNDIAGIFTNAGAGVTPQPIMGYGGSAGGSAGGSTSGGYAPNQVMSQAIHQQNLANQIQYTPYPTAAGLSSFVRQMQQSANPMTYGLFY